MHRQAWYSAIRCETAEPEPRLERENALFARLHRAVEAVDAVGMFHVVDYRCAPFSVALVSSRSSPSRRT